MTVTSLRWHPMAPMAQSHRGDVTIAGLASYPALMLAQLVNILEPRQRRSPVDDRTGYFTHGLLPSGKR